MQRVTEAAIPEATRNSPLSKTLPEIISKRVEFLTAYQNAAYAKRYSDVVAQVQIRESTLMPARAAVLSDNTDWNAPLSNSTLIFSPLIKACPMACGYCGVTLLIGVTV